MRYWVLFLITAFLFQCKPKSKDGDVGFEGYYIIGDHLSARVVPLLNQSYEIDFQNFGNAEIFFFDKMDSLGNYIYDSEEQAMYLVMQPDHLTGTFYEINEPAQPVRKEKY